VVRDDQPETREGCSGRFGVAERLVVPEKPGNAGGGKEPWFKTDARRRKEQEIGQPINSRSVQRLQMALHAKVKVSPGFRFYELGGWANRQETTQLILMCGGAGGCASSTRLDAVDIGLILPRISTRS